MSILRTLSDLRAPLLGQLQRQPSFMVPLLYMAAILALSSVPGIVPDDAPMPYQVIAWVPPQVQNLLHIPIYGGLSLVWCWYLARKLPPRLAMTIALLITITYGAFDEWYQSFIPGRFGSLTDVAFNAVGACLGVLAFLSVHSRRMRTVGDAYRKDAYSKQDRQRAVR